MCNGTFMLWMRPNAIDVALVRCCAVQLTQSRQKTGAELWKVTLCDSNINRNECRRRTNLKAYATKYSVCVCDTKEESTALGEKEPHWCCRCCCERVKYINPIRQFGWSASTHYKHSYLSRWQSDKSRFHAAAADADNVRRPLRRSCRFCLGTQAFAARCLKRR